MRCTWSGAWLRYISFEVITDEKQGVKGFNLREDPAILAFSPHGIFPFSLGFAIVVERAKEYLGEFRLVVTTATKFYPLLRTVDAFDRALLEGASIGLAPGGISKMFEGYPKLGRHPNEKCVILNSRKGFIKMALKHNLPVVPIYCFVSSALMERLHFPFLEKMSNLLRVSMCIVYEVCGLPIPFRKKLLYVVGKQIHPPEVYKAHWTLAVQSFSGKLMKCILIFPNQ